jgi:hypothetical protein
MDTTAFVKQTAHDGYSLSQIITPEIWKTYKVRDFFYPEVLRWFESKEKEDIVILTAITPELGSLSTEFQKEKLFSSGVHELVSEVIFMIGDKGEYVKELSNEHPVCFVDDKLSHLESVRIISPETICVQMRRPDEELVFPKDISIKTIRDLDELDKLVG